MVSVKNEKTESLVWNWMTWMFFFFFFFGVGATVYACAVFGNDVIIGGAFAYPYSR